MIIYRYTSSRKSRRGIPPAQRRVKDTRARTHAHTHMRPARRLSPRVCVAEGIQARARAHTHTHTHTHTHKARTQALTYKRARERACARAHARTHARTHARAHTRGAPPEPLRPDAMGSSRFKPWLLEFRIFHRAPGAPPGIPPPRCAAPPWRDGLFESRAAAELPPASVVRRRLSCDLGGASTVALPGRDGLSARVESPRNSVSFMKLRNGTPCLS